MALLAMDGFDHYNAASAALKGYSLSGGSPVMVAGRFGGQAWEWQASNRAAIRPLSQTATAHVVAGFAFRCSTNVGTGLNVFYLRGGGGIVASLFWQPSGIMQVRNSAGTVIATFPDAFAVNGWYYIELKIYVNAGTPASGSCEVHVNGVTRIATTAGNFGSTLVDAYNIGSDTTNGGVWDYDDLYVLDDSGSAPLNDFLGEVRIAALAPTADGAHTDWTPSPAGSHYANVDEMSGTFPNSDTDYNYDATVGHIDTYAMADLPANVTTVLGVQTNLFARKDDVAARQIAPVVRQGGVDYQGTAVTLASTYQYFTQIYGLDPTGSAWTPANVNGDEFGVATVA